MTMSELKDQFQKITTGNGFQNDLIATTNNRLELTIIELQKLQHVMYSESGFLQSDIQDLREVIVAANKESNSLQNKLLWLSIVATFFTILQAVQVIDILIRGIGK